jgi:hypothetical protein
MKKFALLFLVLPLAACAAPITDAQMQQATEARASCANQHILNDNPVYIACVNGYLQSHYGWIAVAKLDGSLQPETAGHGYARSSSPTLSPVGFGNSSFNTSNQENFDGARFGIP